MAGLVRLGDYCSGHDGYPPRPGIEASNNVFINGRGVHRRGDRWNTHCDSHDCHGGYLLEGSSTIFINGIPAGRVGDRISCGSTAANGSGSIFGG